MAQALAELEADGLIWRHVGRGTFIGARPVLNLADAAYLGELTSPSQVIAARLVIEPELARLAATHATRADLEEILGEQAVDTVIIAGTSAHGAVLHTATGAALRGLRVIIPVDCISAGEAYAEQYTIWHLANAPGSRSKVLLSRSDKIVML